MRAEKYRRSLAEFVRAAWPVIEPATTLIWGPHLDAICLHLQAVAEGKILNLVISIPPNTAKSILASVLFPAWCWTRKPAMRFLCAANEGRLVIRDAVRCRIVLESEWYKEHFPDVELTSDQNEKWHYQNTQLGFRQSVTVGGSVTGKKGDILIIDDPIDAMKAFSQAYRDEVRNWYRNAFHNRVSDARTGARIAIGQRTHEEDLNGYLLSEVNYEELRLPEEFITDRCCTTSLGWQDWRTEPGELLRPILFGPPQIIEAKKTLGSFGYAAQHQQTPRKIEGAMFQRAWFPRAAESPRTAVRVRYWDRAATENGGCFSVGVRMAKDQYGRFWIEDIVFGQWSALHRNQVMLDTAREDKKLGGRCLQIFEQEPGSSGKEVAEATIRMFAGYEVFADKVTGAKEERARPLAAQAEAGNVTILEREKWTNVLLDALEQFPEGGLDFGDAAGGAFNWIAPLAAQQLPIGIPKDGGRNYQLPGDVFQ